MNKLGFYIARTFRREAPMARFSVAQSVLLDSVAGKSIAIVGNARALAQTAYGADIDAHDIVIRINRAPMPEEISHGAKTDWLALATRLPRRDLLRLRTPRVLWMSHKRKRLDWNLVQSERFYLHPLSDYQWLEGRLGHQPTTGAMIIDLVARSDASSIDLYGFDFFSSLSLSGRRTAEDVPHDFNAEARYVEGLIASDPRVTLHAMK